MRLPAWQYAGTLIGYDESTAGETYQVTLKDLYYPQDLTAIGNNTREECTAMSKTQMTDGTLTQRLNDGLPEGGTAWITSSSGYPEFADAPQPASDAVIQALRNMVEKAIALGSEDAALTKRSPMHRRSWPRKRRPRPRSSPRCST